MDRSISIAGEHNSASAALALAIYKALWLASDRGTHPATSPEVREAMAYVGNGKKPPIAAIRAYLKMFIEDDGPVENTQAPKSYHWLPKVPLAGRPDA